jgi:magnesium transporter
MRDQTVLDRLLEAVRQRDSKAIASVVAQLHPADIAEALEELSPPEVWYVLRSVGAPVRGEIFSHLDPHQQLEVAEHLKREELALLVADMPPDDRVDLLKRLPEETIERLLPAIAQAEREDIRRLFTYQEGTAGAVMTSEYATISPEMKVGEAIEKLRKEAPDKETIYYVYVVDDQRRLKGLVSLKDLIIANPNSRIKDIMHEDIIYAKVSDDQEDAAKKIQKYDLIALPVVNEDNALVGIITHDDALDIITQEHTEDMEKFMAIAGRHEVGLYLKTPIWRHFLNRVYWIVGLAALGIISGLIIHSFETVLMQLMILALYMPMVADTGGNTGSQSATVIVRALALGEVTPGDFLKVLAKELGISMCLAVTLGLLSWAKVMWLSSGSEAASAGGFTLQKIAIVIATALGFQVITATLIGAILPLVAARFRADPAVVASPALTTIVDITGLLIYFTTAKTLLGI